MILQKILLTICCLATLMVTNAQNWYSVGNTQFTPSLAANLTFEFGNSDTPFVAYTVSGGGHKASVMKYNGTSWVNVGSSNFSAGTANDLSLAMDTNKVPYVAYIDMSNGTKPTVKKFNGNSWDTIGNQGFAPFGLTIYHLH